MYTKIALVSICFALSHAFACAQKIKPNKRAQFAHHFRVLDSAAAISPTPLINNCPYSIQFMETHTRIEAATGGNYIGKFDCYKSDLGKWHEWYDKKYGNKASH
jgi:hypothetical protein